MALNNNDALKRLKLLLQEPGALKDATPFHRCAPLDDGLRVHDALLQGDLAAGDPPLPI